MKSTDDNVIHSFSDVLEHNLYCELPITANLYYADLRVRTHPGQHPVSSTSATVSLFQRTTHIKGCPSVGEVLEQFV